METLIILLEGLVVVAAIYMGVRTGGVGLGVWGLVGLIVLVLGFREAPGSPPTDAVFIVIVVIVAASVMQAAGGIDWMVSVAAKAIARNPKSITFVAPFMAFLFTVGAGTGNIFYPLLPVIYDVSYGQRIRPERPLAISAVASQVGIICSPVSAATASMTALLEPLGFSLGKILLIMWPASIAGILVAAFVQNKRGRDLDKDPVYKQRVADGLVKAPAKVELASSLPSTARLSALIFLGGVILIVLMGLFPALRPIVGTGKNAAKVSVTVVIQMIMGAVAALMFLTCKVKAGEVTKQSTFAAGLTGAIALFGISWMANTFVTANSKAIVLGLGNAVTRFTILFAVALFVVGCLTTSQSTATNSIVPIGVSLGLGAATITAMWPAVMGMYFLPANGSQIATVSFDQTGSTRIGNAVLNHSFLLPMLIFVFTAVPVGFLMSAVVG